MQDVIAFYDCWRIDVFVVGIMIGDQEGEMYYNKTYYDMMCIW